MTGDDAMVVFDQSIAHYLLDCNIAHVGIASLECQAAKGECATA